VIGQKGGRSAGDVASEIAMSRLNWKGSFLMVEGPSDSKFWKPRKHESCDIVLATGRDQVLGAAQIIARAGLDGVLGIVDDDFDTLTGNVHNVPNVLNTEPRDLEGMLLRSRALDKVLAEYADAQQTKSFLASEPPSVLDALLRRAEFFGKLRLINYLSRKPVSLRALRPPRFRVQNTWTYDEAAIVAEAIRLGMGPDAATITQNISALSPASPWHLCRGHDLLLILADGIKTTLGRDELSEETLSMCLRSGFEEHELRASRLWAEIEAWELQSPPYRVLRR
jgi:Protein of unknown function (DUF4435)